MLRPAALLCVLALACSPVQAREVTTRTWTENGVTWTEATFTETVVEAPGSERLVGVDAARPAQGIASFGPFAVIDNARAALVAETDSRSPADFAAMLRAHPGIRVLDMADCPGTLDDTANLRLGRMIRASGIATRVPDGGSVRSGAVELFLAGASRSAAPDAEFAVHSWLDEDGHEAGDFSADAPVNRAYLAYYREMGLSGERAAAFYALTNSVANDRVLTLRTPDLAQYASVN